MAVRIQIDHRERERDCKRLDWVWLLQDIDDWRELPRAAIHVRFVQKPGVPVLDDLLLVSFESN
jgi:hypothetical protein